MTLYEAEQSPFDEANECSHKAEFGKDECVSRIPEFKIVSSLIGCEKVD